MKGLEGVKLGRYELRSRIAQGGMSEVYQGYDCLVQRRVAVKVLYGSDEPFVRRFEREALAVGKLSQDHILPLYDFGTQSPWYYLVMPFVEGGTLRDYLFKREQLTLEEAGSFLDQIASALQYAHDHGVVHRDVKPSNILLRLDGHAYLVDFGLARAKIELDPLTSTSGTMVGTPEYMAPEHLNDIHDYRSDIYSLGIILYQMLTGHVPFTAESPVAVMLKHMQSPPPPPGQFNSDIPQCIADVILKALAKNPDERYQQANALSLAYTQMLLQERLRRDAIRENCVTPDSDFSLETPAFARMQSPYSFHVSASRPALFPLEYAEVPTSVLRRVGDRIKRPRFFAILLCLLLLSLVTSLTLFWQTSGSTSRPQPTLAATATARQQSNATALAKSEQQATLAAEARVQATAGISPPQGAGNIIYFDNMTHPGGGWLNDGTQCSFSAQGYRVNSVRSHSAAWCYTNQQNFANVAITAQAQLLRGDFYGLVFRLNPWHKTFYVLEINSHSQYRFQRALGLDPGRWLTLMDWTYSSAIQQGYGQTNTFLVIAKGTVFSFYMNRQLLLPGFGDGTYAGGLLGLLVGGDGRNGTEAIFRQVEVLQK